METKPVKESRSIFEILNLRSEYEQIVRNFSLPSRESDIDSIRWFLEHGRKSNSLRNDYGRAREIATIIKEYADGSSQEIRTGIEMVTP